MCMHKGVQVYTQTDTHKVFMGSRFTDILYDDSSDIQKMVAAAIAKYI